MLQSLLLLPAALALLASPTTALALPHSLNNIFRRSLSVTLPSSGLPDPTTISPEVSLRYIALGVGTQNYTCASTPGSASAAPVAIGAIATLYDAGRFLQTFPALIPSLPGLALGLYQMTGAQATSITGNGVLGRHFFNSAKQPVFDLYSAGAQLTAKKLAGVPAPANAYTGPNSVKAVDWLQLTDVGGGASYGGLSYVYRVETAGGSAPASCSGQTGVFTVLYATEYWFYG